MGAIAGGVVALLGSPDHTAATSVIVTVVFSARFDIINKINSSKTEVINRVYMGKMSP